VRISIYIPRLRYNPDIKFRILNKNVNWQRIDDWIVTAIIGFILILLISAMLGFYKTNTLPADFYQEDFSGGR